MVYFGSYFKKRVTRGVIPRVSVGKKERKRQSGGG
jgi:hypothetical protein